MKIKKEKVTEEKLVSAVTTLSKEVSRLKDQEFLQVFKNPWKFLWYSFLKGLMVGFGSVLGASLLVAVFIYLLAQISLIPVVGDFVEQVMEQVNFENAQESTPAEQPASPSTPATPSEPASPSSPSAPTYKK